MSKIWSCIILISIIIAFLTGNPNAVTSSVMSESKIAVENIITLTGMMCFWSGLFKIFENTSLLEKLSNKINKLVLRFFDKNELTKEAEKNMSLNITSNILGIGNAATVNGIKAIEAMAKVNKSDKPSNNMTKFVLINTASLQLIPTSMIALRTLYGSSNPTNILIPVWIVTIVALVVGLVSISILNKIIK
ncbi:MAG: spore maturation protein [Clostridia bacterium]|jgi:spore maturation protein A|nr:spore maturation protein [Clostridia bacterium]